MTTMFIEAKDTWTDKSICLPFADRGTGFINKKWLILRNNLPDARQFSEYFIYFNSILITNKSNILVYNNKMRRLEIKYISYLRSHG